MPLERHQYMEHAEEIGFSNVQFRSFQRATRQAIEVKKNRIAEAQWKLQEDRISLIEFLVYSGNQFETGNNEVDNKREVCQFF